MKQLISRIAMVVCVFLSVFWLQGCDRSPKRFVLDGMVQGTYYHIVFYAQDSTGIARDIKTIFKRIDTSLSLWENNSVVNKVNRNEEVILDSIFIDNFIAAQIFSRMTDGSFDITVGDLVKKQGFSTGKKREKLSAKQIDSLLQYVGFENISLQNARLIKKYPQITLDFNAIAQGYTSDKVAEYLKSKNITSFIVDVGGEVVCGSAKPVSSNAEATKDKWAVGIEQPVTENRKNTTIRDQSERVTNKIIYLENESVVTSGNYRKFYIENGVKYSHTIDPKTGKPVTHSLLSASVIAKDTTFMFDGKEVFVGGGTVADCLATAFMVMGLEKTQQFLAKHGQYAAYLIYGGENGTLQTWQSDNFAPYMHK